MDGLFFEGVWCVYEREGISCCAWGREMELYGGVFGVGEFDYCELFHSVCVDGADEVIVGCHGCLADGVGEKVHS